MFVNGRYLSEAGYWTKTFGLTWCSSAESTEEGCVVFFFFFLSSFFFFSDAFEGFDCPVKTGLRI